MAWRYSIGSLLLLYPALRNLRSSRTPFPPARALRLMVIGAVAQATITFTSLYALNFIPVGLLAFLFYTYPTWLAVIQTLRKTETITPIRGAALVISLIGVAIMAAPATTGIAKTRGVIIALGCALLYAIYLPTLREAQRGLPPISATFFLVLGATISFVIAAVVTAQATLPATDQGWMIIVLMGTICTFIAFTALLNGLRTLGPVRTSIVGTIEPFFTAVLGAGILFERITARIVVGGAMVALAVVLLQLRVDEPESSVDAAAA
jgi:drug/metabolite transporter (DMT)-like permease